MGAGLSGLAYAWRRRSEGRRVLVLAREDDLTSTTPAIVPGETPHLERLLAAIPGAPSVVAKPCEPVQIWTPAGLKSAPAALRHRLLLQPGSLAAVVRAHLKRRGRERPPPPSRVLPGGDGAIRHALATALGSALRFEAAPCRVRPRDAAGGVARVEVSGHTLSAREVVLDGPADVQAENLRVDAPHHADVLRVVPYVAWTHLLVEMSAQHLPPIAGFVRSADTRGRIHSARCLSNLVPADGAAGRVDVRIDTATVAGVGDEALGRIALADVERALGRRTDGRVVGRRTSQSVQPAPGHRRRMAELAADLGGRGVRLLGSAALGDALDRLASAGVPVAGPLPEGVTVA